MLKLIIFLLKIFNSCYSTAKIYLILQYLIQYLILLWYFIKHLDIQFVLCISFYTLDNHYTPVHSGFGTCVGCVLIMSASFSHICVCIIHLAATCSALLAASHWLSMRKEEKTWRWCHILFLQRQTTTWLSSVHT